MISQQSLYLVLGGELRNPGQDEIAFKDGTKIEAVGVYRSYREAYQALLAKSQQSVDNALLRYFLLPVPL